MLYRFESKINDKDYYEFNKFHITVSPDSKKSNLIGKLYLPAIFLIMLIYHIIRGYDSYYLSGALIVYGIISVIWILIFKPFTLLILKIHLKIMKKTGKMPYTASSVLEFYDDYFVELTDETKTEVRYNAIFKVRVNNPKAIYIYQNAVLAHIVPFDAFDSDDERNEFLDFISKKANK